MKTNHALPIRSTLLRLPALLVAWLHRVAEDLRRDVGASRFTVLIERRIG